MAIPFREPRLSDKPDADRIFHSQTHRICEYTFGNIFIWQHYYRSKIAFQDGFLFIRAHDPDGRPFYVFPAGHGDVAAALETLREDAAGAGEPFRVFAADDRMRETLERLYPGRVRVTPRRDLYDYVYNTRDLIELKGKKYHSKRNHIKQFERLGSWRYETIDERNLPDCAAMDDEWCRLNCGQDPGKEEEHYAVQRALQNYRALGFRGGLIRFEGRVVAFSMGEQLSVDTFDTHIEKAFSEVEGAYTVINREFAVHECAGFAYVNREEDMGAEGLRRSKLSYEPAILLRKDHIQID